jgi:DNA polymerase
MSDYQQWRQAASKCLRAGVHPSEFAWNGGEQGALFAPQADEASAVVWIPKSFVTLAQVVARHSNPRRWDLLYRVAWRLKHDEKHLLEIDVDPDVAALLAMRKAVEKDAYRMRQFVRFRRVEDEDGERFVAWYDPSHDTLEENGSFFVERFGAMRWAILTPRASLTWDLAELKVGPGVPRSQAPAEDELEELWRVYYRTVFNPARLKLKAMRAQLPVHRWSNLPEAQAIPDLVRLSRGRVQDMIAAQPRSASDFVPENATLADLRDAVRRCDACELCRRASGPVWGEGNATAKLVLVGEQPGDEEDLAGRPFVGPAGQVLNRAMSEAGIDRDRVYLTNAVRAFKFEERGKRRIHHNPRASEIAACRPWLAAEIGAIRPELIVCLGGSAAQSLLGRAVRIASERGNVQTRGDWSVAVTYHPSTVLRTPDLAQQREFFRMLVEDLERANRLVTMRVHGAENTIENFRA